MAEPVAVAGPVLPESALPELAHVLLKLDELRPTPVGDAHARKLHAIAQAIALDHIRRHKDVLRRRCAAPFGSAQKTVTFIVNFENARYGR